MIIQGELEDLVQDLEMKHPGLDIRHAVRRISEGDFAALLLQELLTLRRPHALPADPQH